MIDPKCGLKTALLMITCSININDQRRQCTTVCGKVCQWLVKGRWLSPGHPVSSTNKTDHQDITEILLKVALNTIKGDKATEALNKDEKCVHLIWRSNMNQYEHFLDPNCTVFVLENSKALL